MTPRLGTAATPNLVAAYGFEAGSGVSVVDASGNGRTGTVANATWSAAGKFGKALSFNGSSSRVTVPDAAALRLTSGMTLEAWVRPAVAATGWRDILYKGNDNYYLEASSSERQQADRGRHHRRQPVAGVRHRPARRQQLGVPGRDVRRDDVALLRQRRPGLERRPHRQHHHLDQPAADRQRQHLRPVLQRPHRRGTHLQHRAQRRPDPDRHDNPGRAQHPTAARYDPADRPERPHRNRGRRRPSTCRGPARPTPAASPATRSNAAKEPAAPPSRCSKQSPPQPPATPASPPTPPTATASAPKTPPPTTAATRTPPPPPPPPPPTPHRRRPRAPSPPPPPAPPSTSRGPADRRQRRHRLPHRTLPRRRLHHLHAAQRPSPPPPTSDTGLTPNTTYSYRVRAKDATPN